MHHQPEDFVMSLLAGLREIGVAKFKADPVKLHSFFYTCRKDPRDAPFVRDFVFDTRDYFPASETLEETLDALQIAGYLERTNPRGVFYLLTESLPSLASPSLQEKFDKRDLDRVRELANEFTKVVTVVSRT